MEEQEIFTYIDTTYKRMVDEHDIINIVDKVVQTEHIGTINAGEENSEMYTFQTNRYYDGVDLSTKHIKIIYQTSDGKFSDDACNVGYSDKHLRFSWVVPYRFAAATGTVLICVQFIGNDEIGNKYSLKTSIFKINVITSVQFTEDSTTPVNWFVDIENRLTYIEENGSADIDLSQYAKKTDLFSGDFNDLKNVPEIPTMDATKEYVNEQLKTKVDVVAGKSLSTNDFTNEYKAKVDSALQSIPQEYVTETELNDRGFLTEHQDLSDYATKNEIPTTLPASDVSAWAKQPSKPNYTASEVGADVSGSATTALNSAKQYTDSSISAVVGNAPTDMNTLKKVSDKVSSLSQSVDQKANKTDLFSGSYNDLQNKPSINNITLSGNITADQLGIQGGKDGVDGTNGKDGIDGKDGQDGADGKSAYELAVENGFSGTESEWLDSLKGKDGTNGSNGIDGINGTDGKSAYELAVESGYSGTETEWLTSLKGADGKDGTDGKDGIDGIDGKDGSMTGLVVDVREDNTYQLTANTVTAISGYCSDIILTFPDEIIQFYSEYNAMIMTSSSGCNLTLPAGCTWDGGNAPTIKENTMYELSIMNKVAILSKGVSIA